MKFKKLILNALLMTVMAFTAIFIYDRYFDNDQAPQSRSQAEKIEIPARMAGYAVPAPQREAIDFTYAAAISTPAVVHVKKTFTMEYASLNPFEGFFDFFNSPRNQGHSQVQTATGSGVIISSDGYIVTNNHVVENADEIEVTLNDNRTMSAQVIGSDPSTDIALIKIDEEDLPAIPFGNSDSVVVGQWVLAVGNPFELMSTVTAGIVSAKGRNINLLSRQSMAPIESFIQTDAAVNPGNSGGALVNTRGELIGINTAIATPTGTYAGYSFAVPVNIVKKVVNDLRNYGIVQRAFLGVNIADVNAALAEEKGLSITRGIYIANVFEGSAADEAGLEVGDVITGINNDAVNSVAELQEKLSLFSPGDEVRIIFNRDGSEYVKAVLLKNKMNTTELVSKSDDGMLDILGATLKNVETESARRFRIRGGLEVIKLRDGVLKENTNIREGFIILSINEKPVASVEDAAQILSEIGEGEGVMIEGFYPSNPSRIYTYVFRL